MPKPGGANSQAHSAYGSLIYGHLRGASLIHYELTDAGHECDRFFRGFQILSVVEFFSLRQSTGRSLVLRRRFHHYWTADTPGSGKSAYVVGTPLREGPLLRRKGCFYHFSSEPFVLCCTSVCSVFSERSPSCHGNDAAVP